MKWRVRRVCVYKILHTKPPQNRYELERFNIKVDLVKTLLNERLGR